MKSFGLTQTYVTKISVICITTLQIYTTCKYLCSRGSSRKVHVDMPENRISKNYKWSNKCMDVQTNKSKIIKNHYERQFRNKKWNKSWIMLLTSVIYSCQLCSFRYMVIATALGWILADLYFLLTYWLSSSDISLFLVTQMWKERNWLNQSLEDCGRKVFKRLVCRSCDNYEVFFTFVCWRGLRAVRCGFRERS